MCRQRTFFFDRRDCRPAGQRYAASAAVEWCSRSCFCGLVHRCCQVPAQAVNVQPGANPWWRVVVRVLLEARHWVRPHPRRRRPLSHISLGMV